MIKTTCNPPKIHPFVQTIRAALFLALSLAAVSPLASAKDDDEAALSVSSRKERIRIDVVRNLKSDGPHYNKVDRVSFKIKVVNEDPKVEHRDLRGVFIIIGQNMDEKKRFTALAREEFKADLGISTANREAEHATKEITTNYDEYRGYEDGEKYDGWLLALIDKEDKIVAYKSSKESYEKNIGLIDGIREGSWFGLDLKKVEKPYNSNPRTTP